MEKTPCQKCKEKTCLETGKPCKEVEKLLNSKKIYKSDFIRPMMSSEKRERGLSKFREIPFSSLPHKIQQRLGIDQEFNND